MLHRNERSTQPIPGPVTRLVLSVAIATIAAFGQQSMPTITSYTALYGSTAGGTLVTLTGTGFQQGAMVTFGQNNATTTTYISPTELTAVTPASTLNGGEGTVGVFVTNPDGGSGTAPLRFTYHFPPSVTSLAPPSGSAGQTLTVNGQDFHCVLDQQGQCTGAGPSITFGSVSAPSIFLSGQQLTIVAPANSAGTISVTATNWDGLSASLPNGFTYQPLGIASIAPNIGPTGGGETVTINGAGFLSGATVQFGSTNATNVKIVNGGQLTCVTPANAAGTVSVTVTDPNGGGSATLPNSYTYTSGPVITNIKPKTGGAGTSVTLSGFNLGTVTSVLFAAAHATITSKTARSLVVRAPPQPPGTTAVNVTVTSPQGTFQVHSGFVYGLTFTTQGLDDAYPTGPYNETLTASGGTPPYTYSLVGGSLPPGLKLNSATGEVTGTPSGPYQQYNPKFQVTDSSAPPKTSSEIFSFNVLFGFEPVQIPPTFFGMIIYDQTKWPVPQIQVGALGKGLGTLWPFVEQKKGSFDWSITDQYIADAQNHKVTYYTTNANVPFWAAKDPKTCSYYPGTHILACTSAVKKISDLHSFMTALITRYKGKIQMYELWNEPDVANDYTGSITDLVAMTNEIYADVRRLDPNALIANIAPTGEPYQLQYFQAGGTKMFDIFAIHGYPNVGIMDVPEAIVGFKSVNMKTLMVQEGIESKPLWDTESSWGGQDADKDPDYRASYAARSLLLHWSVGFQRFYWYGYDSPVWGTLYDPAQNPPLLEAGVAYGQVQNWMLGATMPYPCSSNGGTVFYATYTCDLTRPGGYIARAVWDSTQQCSNGCTYSSYTPDPMFTQYRDIAGNVFPISPPGTPVQIGLKPILLENMNANP